ncbi:monoamine oxidase [Mucilaginibacter frigoritolerans]|uniref:Tryptophan 2-monooxygenase n=1 Tax=Mucilaginibacter frigoritolerans TaxID=652788 RepID=A0A562TS42_9SPHI|nr:monoamine oxidase [Mucilaginibacter frigoritolerans]
MDKCEVLIIGAGAAGLMAAYTLAQAGKKVTVLEARERSGGRIHTLHNELFFKHVELGAEFIHGDLPVTLQLLKEANIDYLPASGEMWQYKNGEFEHEGGFIEEWDLLMKKLLLLKHDISIEAFLEKEFAGDEYNELKKSVRRFVSGYDTADPEKASTFALRNEWLDEDNEAQHRVKDGYGVMIKYLEQEITNAGSEIYLNSIAKEIQWEQGKVTVLTLDGTVYEAAQIVVALPLGILQADKNQKAAVSFDPPIPEQHKAIADMGFGAIIKVLLEFDESFWLDDKTQALAGKSLENMGFLLSAEEIPTWWTQVPQHSTVLTGWLGGPPAALKKDIPDEEVLQQALQSLSNIFKITVDELKDKLTAFYIANWTSDPFTLGSYAYDTMAASQARRILNNQVNNTLFFAGEYLYEGAAMGTVEAALSSGQEVAKRILK